MKGDVIAAHKIHIKRRGNTLGFWFFKQTLKFFGLNGAYLLLSGVAIHYLLFDFSARRNTMAYVKHRFPDNNFWGDVNAVYRIFLNQGRNLIDRYAAMSEEVLFDLRLASNDVIKMVNESPKGCVLLSSHVGNWQIAMPAFTKVNKKVYLVMRPEDNRAIADSLKISRENQQFSIISPENSFGGAIEIVNAINEGAIVSIMGDRPYGFETVRIPSFLGDAASFPFGAFHVAALCQAPVVIFLSAKTAHKQYTVNISRVIYPVYEKGKPKKDQLTAWVSEYAAVLEEFVRQYPYQCFIFSDIWKKS